MHPGRRTTASDCSSVSSTRRWFGSTAWAACGPGLATSWRLDADGRTLDRHVAGGRTFLRRHARHGCRRAGELDARRHRGEFRPHVSRLVQSVDVVGDRALAIQLSSRRVDAPVALLIPTWPSPSGSPIRHGRSARDPAGSHRPVTPRERIAASELTISRDHLPPLRFLVAPGDPRDLLDAGVDLLLTRDPATLDYAATLPHFQLVPLAWQRTHVLLTPGRSGSSPSLSEDARQALADDAVRGEARGAQGPFWWESVPDCQVATCSRLQRQPPTPRIVYDANDGAARDLAERFVGLARASGPAAATFLDALLPDRPRRTFQRATGLTGEALANARRLGTDAGYIVSVESRPLDPCRDLQRLMDSARWLDPDDDRPARRTRLQAVVRRGRAGITADFDGRC